MEEMRSIKKKMGGRFRVAWASMILILAAIIGSSFLEFTEYESGQATAIDFTLASTDQFNDYQDDYETMVTKMYDYFNPEYSSFYVNGYWVSNSEVVSTARDADRALGRLMSDAGYDCYYGSDYLEYTNFGDFTLNTQPQFYVLWILGIIILLVVNLCYASGAKAEMVLTEDKIVCKKGKNVKKEFLIKDITSVESAGSNGIRIIGNGIYYKITNLQNAAYLKEAIMSKLSAIPNRSVAAVPQGRSMEISKNYAPALYRNVCILCIVLVIIGAICFMIGLADGDGMLATWGMSLLGCALTIWIDFVIACQFYHIAIDKGYTQPKYLAMAFVLTMVGYALIIAMPNKNAQAAPSTNATTVFENIAQLKKQGILSEDDAAKMMADALSKM